MEQPPQPQPRPFYNEEEFVAGAAQLGLNGFMAGAVFRFLCRNSEALRFDGHTLEELPPADQLKHRIINREGQEEDILATHNVIRHLGGVSNIRQLGPKRFGLLKTMLGIEEA